ncbi:hypothetical protein DM01DRAFT_1293215 [Hesseltinella vesiculosa]|uniref:Histone acetyltransferase n=1 Tax=Hesseltinella vesiculosa TaxID=101127 RepID=A0A1X2G8P1_9FUNG|nr:hypothetical protein DM01DRAFT_1293215 [Hesseltinella vesiculosa]
MSVDPDDSGSEAGGNDVSPASSPPHGTKQKLPTTAIWPHPSIPDPSPAFLQIGSLPRLPIWHPAPFPQEYAHLETLFLCDLCLKYMPSSFVASRHKLHCVAKHPPGSEIYRDGPISIFEVDGRKSKAYCQNLCLLAKSYLNHKTLYYDVEPFLFYVLTLADSTGCHFAGYFSKEKTSEEAYNLSCIMTLPLYQSQGFGQLLIDLRNSKENKLGSPEKPLSSLGLKCYDKYWAAVVFACLADAHAGQQPLSVQDICYKTRMTKDDVLYTLAQNQWLAHTDPAEPYHFVLRSPFPANTNHRRIKRNQLHWVPF